MEIKNRTDEIIRKESDEWRLSDIAGLMLVYIQGIGENGAHGQIYSFSLDAAIDFCGAGDMVLKLDAMCSQAGGPMATTEPRFLNKEMERRYKEACPYSLPLEENHQKCRINRLHSRCVLKVHVRYRQFSSMQGSVCGRLTKGRIVHFRSGLELMRMIDMIQL